MVAVDATDSAGDTRPAVVEAVVAAGRALDGRAIGGRMDFLGATLGRVVDVDMLERVCAHYGSIYRKYVAQKYRTKPLFTNIGDRLTREDKKDKSQLHRLPHVKPALQHQLQVCNLT